MIIIIIYTVRKNSESVNLREADILNFVESDISCQNYFLIPVVFPSLVTDEDILYDGRAQLPYDDFRTAIFDLEL